MPTFYELFAGVGLVRDALEPLGWECVYANDIDATKEAIYRRRYPKDNHFDRRDIWEIDATALPRSVDLIAASFPCIDLSVAGNRKGLAGTHSGTFWAFMRLVDQLRELGDPPKALIIENVTGFLSSHGGRDFREAVQAINDRGYVVDAVEVSAEHFTPQSRPRLFIIAFRGDLAGKVMTLPHEGVVYQAAIAGDSVLRSDTLRSIAQSVQGWGIVNFPPLPRRTLALADIIDKEGGDWWSVERVEKFLTEMAPLHQARLRSMKGHNVQRFATAYRRVRHGQCVYELRTDGIAGCLRTAGGGSSKQIVVAVMGETIRVRWMSPAEYARLQGVPNIDNIVGFKDNDLRTAFGDAVCVPTYRWVADHALGSLLGRVPEFQAAPRQLALI